MIDKIKEPQKENVSIFPMETERVAIVFFLGKRADSADRYVYQYLSSGIKILMLVPSDKRAP